MLKENQHEIIFYVLLAAVMFVTSQTASVVIMILGG
jgi:hypothetical protein